MEEQTLLQKYAIPISHLDFAYIAKCSDSKEMEKIVKILHSGEEGHFPDLTKCAEDKLRKLKPNSKMFRVEEQLLSRNHLGASDWKPIYEWTSDIKSKDRKLAAINKSQSDSDKMDLPPIRKSGNIKGNKTKPADQKNDDPSTGPNKMKSENRVNSTDYRKWDKYDADEEILKIDLIEERNVENVERINRKKLRDDTSEVLITEITEDYGDDDVKRIAPKLTQLEREKLVEDCRIRGNDNFRAKEYLNAINEYTRCIQIDPTSATTAYNNRAIANIKLKKFTDALKDCDCCLQLDADNIKALMRKAESLVALERKREAYETYLRVTAIDSKNIIAVRGIEDLLAQLGKIAPSNATRLQIQEDHVAPSVKKNKSTPILSTNKSEAPLNKDFDLASLVIPNNLVKSKLSSAMETLKENLKLKPRPKSSPVNDLPKFQIPSKEIISKGQTLIEEL